MIKKTISSVLEGIIIDEKLAVFMDNKLQLRVEERIEWVKKIIDFVAPKYDEIIENLNSKGTQINVEMWQWCGGEFLLTEIPQITRGLRLDINGNWLHLIRNQQNNHSMKQFWRGISNHLEDDWTNSRFPGPMWQFIGDLEHELDKLLFYKLSTGLLDDEEGCPIEVLLESTIRPPVEYNASGQRTLGSGSSLRNLRDILEKFNVQIPTSISELCKTVPTLVSQEKSITLRYNNVNLLGQKRSIRTNPEHIGNNVMDIVKSNFLQKLELAQVEKLLDS